MTEGLNIAKPEQMYYLQKVFTTQLHAQFYFASGELRSIQT